MRGLGRPRDTDVTDQIYHFAGLQTFNSRSSLCILQGSPNPAACSETVFSNGGLGLAVQQEDF